MDAKKLTTQALDIVRSDAFQAQLKLAGDVCSQLVDYYKRPSNIALMKIGFNIAYQIMEQRSNIWSDDFFPSASWDSIFSGEREIQSIIHDALKVQGDCTFNKKTSDDNYVKKFSYMGCEFGFIMDNVTPYSLQIRAGTQKASNDAISDAIRKYCKSDTIVLKRRQSENGHEKIGLEADPYDLVMENSELTQSISNNMKRFIDAGINRSMMMYGLPGTGKSTLARAVLKNLGYRTLRIKVEDASSSSSTIKQILKVIQPDAILLDDFDRSEEQRQLLELMEEFKRSVKLVIATVNDRSKLDEAIMRPGRFDELVPVDCLDATVVRSLLGPYEDAFETVKEWPVAFINEYVIRRKIMTDEEAKASLKELIERVERLEATPDSETQMKELFTKLVKGDGTKATKKKSKRGSKATTPW